MGLAGGIQVTEPANANLVTEEGETMAGSWDETMVFSQGFSRISWDFHRGFYLHLILMGFPGISWDFMGYFV